MVAATVAGKKHDYVFLCVPLTAVRVPLPAEKGSGGAWPLRGKLTNELHY